MVYQMMTVNEVEKLISLCDKSLTKVSDEVLNAEGRVHGEHLQRLREVYFNHHKNITFVLDFMLSQRRPQIEDVVCGTLVADRGDSEWIQFHGKIIRSDELFHVSVQFDSAEYMDVGDEGDTVDTANYIGVEIIRHAAELEWNEDHWVLTL